MNRSAAKDALARQGWLSVASQPLRNAIFARASLQRYAPGQAVFRFGDPPGGIYGIASGVLHLEAPAPNGEMFVHAVAGPGAWLGWEAMFTRADRHASLLCAERAELLHVPLAGIMEIVGSSPSAWMEFGRIGAEAARNAVAASTTLMLRDPRMRALATIARLAANGGAAEDGAELAISQQMLASAANLSRTSLAAVLAELRADGTLTSRYRRIVLSDPRRLAALMASESPAAAVAPSLAQARRTPAGVTEPRGARRG